MNNSLRLAGNTSTADRRNGDAGRYREARSHMKPSKDRRRPAYYRADVQGLNVGDPATRTLDPLDGKEYTYATTRLEVARAIAARHSDFCVYRVELDKPIEVDPDAAEDNLGQLFVRSPSGTVLQVVDQKRS